MRFPGFEEEWEKLKVRDFTKVVAGATPATDKKEYWGGAIRWMNSGELNLKRVYEVQGRITQLGYDKTSTKIIPSHSVLIGLAGQGKTRGTAAINYVELCTNQSIASLLPSDSFYPEFLFQNIESRYKELRDISSGDGGRGGLNLQMIYNLNIPRCSMQEQKKIGDFLYLLDQRIAIQNKVIEDLKKLKTALCESLYDESEPNYKMGDIIEQISIRNRQGDIYKVLSVSNQLGFIEQSEQFEGRTIASQDTSNYKIVSLDDFAYNPARINVGSIARLKGFEKGIVSPMYVCFRCKKGILPDYLESFFDTDYFSIEMEKRIEGSVRMCLSFEGLCNIPIAIPDPQKQNDVARKIQVLKDKINLEESINKYLNFQKQSILYQLFI